MKYIKLFEEIDNKPEVGDYVICVEFDSGLSGLEKFNHFLSNNIGKIIFIATGQNHDDIEYYVTFDNPPEDILDYAFYTKRLRYINNIDKDEYEMVNDEYTNITEMDGQNIIHCSKNKEELEIKLAGNKYNL